MQSTKPNLYQPNETQTPHASTKKENKPQILKLDAHEEVRLIEASLPITTSFGKKPSLKYIHEPQASTLHSYYTTPSSTPVLHPLSGYLAPLDPIDIQLTNMYTIGVVELSMQDANSRRGGAKNISLSFFIAEAAKIQEKQVQVESKELAGTLVKKEDTITKSKKAKSSFPQLDADDYTRISFDAKLYSKKGFFNKYSKYTRGKYGKY